uniref:Uncharacterized protein n=1 Tax=Arion vulgaris TaxID=1028688 RepID=A0A0B6YBF6_9EUPU
MYLHFFTLNAKISNMLRCMDLTFLALCTLTIQSSAANLGVPNNERKLENSASVYNDIPLQLENTNLISDSNNLDKSSILRQHICVPTLKLWMEAARQCMIHSTTEYPIKMSGTEPAVSREKVAHIPLNPEETNLENLQFPVASFSTAAKSDVSPQQENFDDINYSYKEHRTPDDMFQRFRKNKMNRMPFTFGKRNTDTRYDFDMNEKNLNQKSDYKQNVSYLNKNKINAVNGDAEMRQHMHSQVRQFGQVMKVVEQQEENKVGASYANIDHLLRTTRDVLNRMPVTYGKREEGDTYLSRQTINPIFRLRRDRIGRMPVTFGKRSSFEQPDDRDVKRSNIRIMDRFLNRQSARFPSSQENDNESEINDGDSFVRTAKGSLNRMPLAFGKRSNTRDSKYFERTSRNQIYRTPAVIGNTQYSNQDDDSLITKISDQTPSIFRNTENVNGKFDKSEDFQFPESSIFTRYERSKLERMPLAFGKRYLTSIDGNNDANNFYNVRKRSRLGRMPVSFG